MTPVFPVGRRPAGAGARVTAGITDLALLLTLMVLLNVLVLGSGVVEAEDLRSLAGVLEAISARTGMLVLQVLPLLGLCWWRLTHDATPGQRLAGVEVACASGGSTPGRWRLLLRGLALLLVVLTAGLGLLWMLFDRDRRALQDRLSETVMVEEDEASLPLSHLAGMLE